MKSIYDNLNIGHVVGRLIKTDSDDWTASDWLCLAVATGHHIRQNDLDFSALDYECETPCKTYRCLLGWMYVSVYPDRMVNYSGTTSDDFDAFFEGAASKLRCNHAPELSYADDLFDYLFNDDHTSLGDRCDFATEILDRGDINEK